MAAEYEVAGELIIIDRATRVLERTLVLARDLVVEFDRLSELGKDLFAGTGIRGFNNHLTRTDPLLASVSKSMEAASSRGIDSFNAMTDAAARLETAIGAVRDEMAETAAVARSMRIPAVPAAGGRGGGAHGGGNGNGGAGRALLFGRGDHGGEMGHGATKYAGWGILGAAAYGTLEESKLQGEVNRILLGGGQPLDSQYRAPLEQTIRGVSADTGVNYEEAGEAVKNTVLGFPNVPFDQRLGFAASRARYAMIEHLIKPEISLREAEEASIGLTHMAGNYTPKAMEKMQADIAAITTLTPENLRTVERAASYAMPLARVAGILPETVFSIITANQIAGVTNTKSGTWLGDLVTTGLNPKGGLAALISTKAGRHRAEMMERLGLMDRRGHFTGMEMLEQGNFLGLQKLLEEHTRNIPKEQLAGDFAIAAGGVQPGRQLALLSEANVAQIATLALQKQTEFLGEGADKALREYTKYDPSLQLHKTMMDFTNALSNLGTVVLPPLTSVLQSLDKTLRAVIPGLPGGDKDANLTPGDLAKAGGTFGAGAGLLLGGPPGAFIGGLAGAGAGYASGAMQATERLALGSGGVIDPTTGNFVPLDLNTPAPSANSHGAGKLGEWFDRVFLGGGAADHAGADKVTQAVADGTGKVAASAKSDTDRVVSAIQGLAASLPAGIRGAINSAIAHEAGKPPTDAGGVDSRLAPLYPATAQ